jgi:lysophospholipase L1-like esterase
MKYSDKLWTEFRCKQAIDEINNLVSQNLQEGNLPNNSLLQTKFIKFAAIGDSQTTQYWGGRLVKRNYLTQLAEINPQVQITFNKGLGGKRVTSKKLQKLAVKAASTGPDYIVLQGAANDIMSGISSNRIIEGFRKMISDVRSVGNQLGKVPKVILITTPSYKTRSDKARSRGYKYWARIPQTVKDVNRWILGGSWALKGDIAVDAAALLGKETNKPGLFFDYIHYGEKAHRLIALQINSSINGPFTKRDQALLGMKMLPPAINPSKITAKAAEGRPGSGLISSIIGWLASLFGISQEIVQRALSTLGFGGKVVPKNKIFSTLKGLKKGAISIGDLSLGNVASQKVPSKMSQWHPLVEKWATHFNIPVAAVYAVMYKESGGRNGLNGRNKSTCKKRFLKRGRYARKRVYMAPGGGVGYRREQYTPLENCESEEDFGKNITPSIDRGLMQINDYYFYMDNYNDADQNIRFGCWQLSRHSNTFGLPNDKRNSSAPDSIMLKIFTAYNAGAAGVKTWGGNWKGYGMPALKKFHAYGGWSTMPNSINQGAT